MQKKPNIVLITIESLRADFVGYQNPKELNTPFLDSLSKESFVYMNAIAPGIPTFFHFPSLMTGRLPFSYGYKLGIDSDKSNKTIAEALRENGYNTIAVLGDNPQLYSLYNFDRGFDIYLDGLERTSKSNMFMMNTLWNIKQKLPGKAGDLLNYFRAALQVLPRSSPSHIPGKDLNQMIMNELPKKSAKPFFLWTHYMEPHYPYSSGIQRIKGVFRKIVYYKKLVNSVKDMKIEDNEVIKLIKEAYRGCVQEVDAVIGALYKQITTTYPNTIFIVTSDHGEAFMEHGMYYHEAFSLYDELIKVPLLIHFPSKKKKVFTEVVSTVSLAKTICSILNIKNDTFDGTDLANDKQDTPINHISRILYRCRAPSIRYQIFDNETEIKGFNELLSYSTSQYKYIKEKGGEVEEFYDLEKDPKENNNIIHKVSKKILSEIKKKLTKI